MTVIGPTSIIPILKDIAVTIAAIIGAVVAWQGLSAWKWQLTCQTEYDLARRVLRATYNYRDAINTVRSPLMQTVEMPDPPDGSSPPSPSEKHWYELAHGYEKRWEHILKSHSELNAELLEAEVLWGREFCAGFFDLFSLENELHLAIITFIHSNDPKARMYKNTQSQSDYQEMFKTLFGSGNFDDDIFLQKITKNITKLETTLQPHLKLNRLRNKHLSQR